MTRSRKLVRNVLFVAMTTSALVSVPVAAFAQVTVPNAARPENIQRQLKVDTKRPAVGGAAIVSQPEQEGKSVKGGVSFTLRDVKFEGAKDLDVNELKSLYQDKIGKKFSTGELNRLASSVTSYYRNKGYILTRAVVPPQRIGDGIAKIRIVEGFVDDVQLKVDVGSSDSVLYKYAEKIKASKPLDAATLEHYLLLMEDLPGVEARAVIQPSPNTSGASRVVVDIKRNKFQGTTALINNRGTRFLGQTQATAIGTVNNALGRDETTSIRVTSTIFEPEELKYIGLHHEYQLGARGTKLLLDGNFVATEPGYTLEPFDVKGRNYALSAGVSHPIIRSRQTNWFVNSDFTAQRINLSSLDVNLYQDHLRVLKLGSAYDFLDSTNAVNRLEANIHKGFDWDTGNGGLSHSRNNGKASFWKGTANATRIQPLFGAFSAFASVDGQYSADPLYAAEEYALGGERFGSAYDPAELSGDSALAGRLELQYNGTSNYKYLPSYQPYAFYDIGKVWNRDRIGTSELKEASLASTGVGVRMNMAESLVGGAEFAVPLTRSVAANGQDGEAPRVFFNLQYRY